MSWSSWICRKNTNRETLCVKIGTKLMMMLPFDYLTLRVIKKFQCLEFLAGIKARIVFC